MKIKVIIGKKREEKYGLKRITLLFPTSLLKSRLAVSIIRNGLKREKDKGKYPVISPDYITRDLLRTIYSSLKYVIKQHGHFDLIEVDAADGTEVRIRL